MVAASADLYSSEVGRPNACGFSAHFLPFWNVRPMRSKPLSADIEEGKETEDPTITNTLNDVRIVAYKTSRESGEAVEGAVYGLWMVNEGGTDVYMGNCVSDKDGRLEYDIPPTEGVTYYLKEEGPAPAGHLIDPYPTDYFTLIITDDGSFDLVYEYEFASQDEFMDYVASRVNG